MRSLSSFFKNHGLFDLLKRPQWFSILGGSNTYIDKLINCSNINSINIEASLHIERDQEKVIVKNNEVYKEYDAIIFACHANQIEEILKDMSSEEKEIFFLFEYTRNNVLLHCDRDLMPKQKSLWSSWNSFKSEKYDYVSYWMNNLQKLDTKKDIFVTLGNYPEIDKERIFKSLYYEHPLYTEQTLEAQKLVKSIQGKNKTFYVGAHLGYGFHEDGIKSTVEMLKIING